MNDYWLALHAFSRDIRLYLVSALAIGFAYFGVFVVLFNLYLLRLGYGPRFIGAINAVGPITYIVGSWPAGALGRRFGSRRMVIVGLSLYMLGFGLIPFAEFVPSSWEPYWLMTMMLLAFAGSPFFWVNSSMYMMAATTARERGYVFSARAALFPLAGFVGGLAGGLLPGVVAGWTGVTLADPAPYRYILWVSVLAYVPAIGALLLARDNAVAEVDRTAGSWSALPLLLVLPLILIEFLRMATEMGSLLFFNVYLDDGLGVATSRIGATVAVASLLAGVATLTFPLMTARWGNGRTLRLSIAGMSLSLLVLALVPRWTVAALSFVLLLAFANISRSVFLVYRMELVAPALWAAMASVGVIAQGFGQTSVLFGGGFLIDALGYQVFFLVIAVAALLSGVCFWLFERGPAARPATA